jgi:hypothetical protein
MLPKTRNEKHLAFFHSMLLVVFCSIGFNESFVLPSNNSILQAYEQGIPGVFTTDFPANPPRKFDYTGNVSRLLWQPVLGTKEYK